MSQENWNFLAWKAYEFGVRSVMSRVTVFHQIRRVLRLVLSTNVLRLEEYKGMTPCLEGLSLEMTHCYF